MPTVGSALHRVTLRVEPGEVVTIIGANGAGKTTLLRTISGIYRPQGGSISFENQDIARMAPEKSVSLGISQVPEGRQVFVQQPVEGNLELGAFHRRGRPTSELREDLNFVYSLFKLLLLDEPSIVLSDKASQLLQTDKVQMIFLGQKRPRA